MKQSLDELLNEKKEVYVRNNAQKAGMVLILQMRDRNGRAAGFKIPPTNIPMCLSERFPAEVLRESTDLREMISKELLVIMDPTEAKAILNTEEAREEIQALKASVYADSAPANAMRSGVEKIKKQAEEVMIKEASELKEEIAANDSGVSHRVRGMVASLKAKEKSARDTLTGFKRMRDALTEGDLAYVLAECKDDSQIREFAEKTLVERSK